VVYDVGRNGGNKNDTSIRYDKPISEYLEQVATTAKVDV
jgi:hypothetical protein